MVPRDLGAVLPALLAEFPVVALTGPRQSGKSTLVRHLFPDRPYVSLEDIEERRFADEDPRGFLGRFPDGAVLDEVQRCPDLFSYLQGIVDADGRTGLFVLTGSQQLGLLGRITQSLAGRVGLARLFPFSLGELEAGGYAPASLDDLLFRGQYPAIYDRRASPVRWYDSYVTTYLERDVRNLGGVQDLGAFDRFLRLCAGRVGSLVNYSTLGADCGVSYKTAQSWLSILEASYVVTLLRPHHRNFRKRIVKAPKLYFVDTGLAVRLLRIRSVAELATHAARGALFENWAVSELTKAHAHRAEEAALSFWRSHAGLEIDVLLERSGRLEPIECKSGATVASEWFSSIARWKALAGKEAGPAWLVYGGESRYRRESVEVVPWRGIADVAAA